MFEALLVKIVVCSMAVMVLNNTPVQAQDPSAASRCSDYQTLFEGLRDGRLRLTSGVYRGKGHRVFSADARDSMEGDVSFFCAFDYLNNRIRSDRYEPAVFRDPKTGVESVRQIGYQFVQTRERTLYLDLGGGMGTSNILSVAAPDFRPPPYGRPFDVRTFGLVDWDSIEVGAAFEEAIDALDKCNVVNAREESDGTCMVTIVPTRNVRIELWINSDRGYTIERSEMRALKEETKQWSEVMVSCDVEWVEHEAVWVPTSIHLERHFNGPETYFATLEWERVNEEPAASLFEPSGFGLDPESLIVDDRLGRPVVIGTTGGGEHPSTPPKRLGPKEQTGKRFLWLFVGNAVGLVVVGVCYYLWRRRYRR